MWALRSHVSGKNLVRVLAISVVGIHLPAPPLIRHRDQPSIKPHTDAPCASQSETSARRPESAG